jgi:anti-sigma factor RsiW
MNDDIHALSGAYAVDAVDDAERTLFERHLAACAECQAEVAGFRATTEQLAELINATPPERLRDQVLHDISLVRPIPPEVSRQAAERIEGRSRGAAPHAERGTAGGATATGVTSITSRVERRQASGTQRVNRWLAAAAAVVVLGGGTVAALHPWDRQSQVQVSLADRVLQAPDAQRFVQTVASGGTATVVRSKSVGRAVLETDHFVEAPSGKVYQLWLQAPGGRMVSAGLLPTASDQTVVLDGDAASALGAGISVEPAGGSPQPTTSPVALIAFA